MGSPPQFQSFNSISSVMFLDCTIAIGCFNSDHDHDEWEGLQWQPITALLWLLIWLLLPIPKSAKGYFRCLPQSVSCRVPVSIWLFPVILIHFLRNDKEFWAPAMLSFLPVRSTSLLLLSHSGRSMVWLHCFIIQKQSLGYINDPLLVWCFQLEGEKWLQTAWHVAVRIICSLASQAPFYAQIL